MAENIQVVTIDIPLQQRGIKAAIKDEAAYKKLIQQTQFFRGPARTNALRRANKVQARIESRVSSLLKTKLVQGKLGRSDVPSDFLLTATSPLTKLLKDRIATEFKASGGRGLKVGQLTLASERNLIVPTTSREAATTTSVSSIKKEVGVGFTGDSTNLLDLAFEAGLISSTTEGADITGFVFNTLFAKSRDAKNIFYGKANALTIYSTSTLGLRISTFTVPPSDFNASNMKAEIGRDKAIVLYVNDKYQNEIFNAFNKAIVEEFVEAETRDFVKTETGKNVEIIALPYGKFLNYGAEGENSIRTGSPVSAKVRTDRNAKRSDALKLMGDAQLTSLVQRETERRMPKGPDRGPPLSPTVLTYRSGQFVESIKVIQNFRQQLITYYYAPNYRVHEKRGARAPRFLLQGSIRDTVKAVYGTRFRIVRGF